MILSLGRPVRLTSIYLPPAKPTGSDPERDPPTSNPFNPQPARPSNTPTCTPDRAPTILARRTSPLKFEHLLPAWFEVRERHDEVVTLLLTLW